MFGRVLKNRQWQHAVAKAALDSQSKAAEKPRGANNNSSNAPGGLHAQVILATRDARKDSSNGDVDVDGGGGGGEVARAAGGKGIALGVFMLPNRARPAPLAPRPVRRALLTPTSTRGSSYY